MTEKERLIRARFSMLVLIAEVKNVTRACKLVGVSRSQFYAMRKAYEAYGEDALAPRARQKPVMPNQTPVPIENLIMFKTQSNPSISYLRLAGSMKSEGVNVTPTMVRYVWERHGLSTRSARLRWVKMQNGRAGEEKMKDGPNAMHRVHIRG